MKRLDLVGKKFGKLKVLSFHSNDEKRKCSRWLCECTCGNKKVIRGSSLTYKIGTRSCGQKQCHGRTLPFGESSFNYVYNRYQQNAKKRNLSFNLNKKQFTNLILDVCHYCGDSPKNKVDFSNYFGTLMYNGIDRKNNALGYSIKNCVTCCKECNFLKKATNYTEFLNKIKKIYETRINDAHFL